MTAPPPLPKRGAIAPRAATGLRRPRSCAQRMVSARPPGSGRFAPARAGADHAHLSAIAAGPLACACALANRTGEQSTGLFAVRSEGRP